MCQTDLPIIEVRNFKWPHRPTSVAMAYLLGEDTFGQWLAVVGGSRWWTEDGSRSGVFESSFVKVVPNGTFWTACFNSFDPVVDVDIVLPVNWVGNVLEEVDLELDILRTVDGTVHVRDQDAFARVRSQGMSIDVALQAQATCESLHIQVAQRTEPFGDVGPFWLSRFLAATSRGFRGRIDDEDLLRDV